MSVETLTFEDFADRYCQRQMSTPPELREVLLSQAIRYQPCGWMLLECQMLGGTQMGSLVILPYGPNNTWKEPPSHPISPRGLASDMSTVVAILPFEEMREK